MRKVNYLKKLFKKFKSNKSTMIKLQMHMIYWPIS